MSGRSSGTLRLTNLALLTTVALIIFDDRGQSPTSDFHSRNKNGTRQYCHSFCFLSLQPERCIDGTSRPCDPGALASGQIMTLPYSLSGGLLCFCVWRPAPSSVPIKAALASECDRSNISQYRTDHCRGRPYRNAGDHMVSPCFTDIRYHQWIFYRICGAVSFDPYRSAKNQKAVMTFIIHKTPVSLYD